MMDDPTQEHLITNREPDDGLSANMLRTLKDGDEQLVVYIDCKKGGQFVQIDTGHDSEEPIYQLTLWTKKMEIDQDRSEQQRVWILVDALCRYFNLGGEAFSPDNEAMVLLSSLGCRMEKLKASGALPRMDLADFNFELAGSEIADGVWQHTWSKEDCVENVVWREGEFWDIQHDDELGTPVSSGSVDDVIENEP